MTSRDLATNSSGTFLKLPRVVDVQPQEDLHVHLTFSDGLEKDVNLEPYLRSPIFKVIREDPAYFRTVHVDVDTIAWPNGLDIAPETLYYESDPPWVAQKKTVAQTFTGRVRHRAKKRRPRANSHGV